MAGENEISSRLVTEAARLHKEYLATNLKAMQDFAGISRSMRYDISKILDNTTDAADEYSKKLKTLISGDTKAHQERRDQLKDIWKVEQKLSDYKQELLKKETESTNLAREAEKKLNDTKNKSVAAEKTRQELQEKLSNAQLMMLDGVEELTKQLAQATKECDELADSERQYTLEQAHAMNAQHDYTKAVKHATETHKQVADTLTTTTAKYQNKLGIARDNVVNKMEAVGQRLGTTLAAMFTYQNAIGLYYNSIKGQITSGINVSYGQETAMNTIGMSGAEYAEYSKRNRGTVLAQGGTDSSIDALKAASDSFRLLIPDLKERNKFLEGSFQNLMAAGIVPTQKRMEQMSKTYVGIQKLTNLTSEQFNTAMADMLQNETIQQQLRMANTQDERDAIQNSIALRLAENAALGKSAELTIKQTKAMMAQAGGPAKDRLKQSLQLAQLASISGMSPQQARRMQELQAKGSARMSDTEKAEMVTLKDELKKRVSTGQNAGRGITGLELMYDTLTDKIQGQGLERNDMTYNALVVKPAENAAANLGDVATSAKEVVNAFERVKGFIQTSALAQGAGAVSGTVLSSIFGGGIGAMAGRGIGGLLGGGAAAGGAGAAAGGAGALASLGPIAAVLAAGGASYFGTRALMENTEAGGWLSGKIGDGIDWATGNNQVATGAVTPEQISKAREIRKAREAAQAQSQTTQPTTTPATIQEKETLDPSKKMERDNATRFQKMADNSDYLPKILDVAEKSLAVAVAGSSNKAGFSKLIKSGASSGSWSQLLSQ